MSSQVSCLYYLLAIGALLSYALRLDAAWKVDPDFRPLPGFGFSETSTAVQPDGKVLVNRGLTRLNADGSLDATYAPADDERSRVWVSPIGQVIALYEDSSYSRNSLNWLNSDGTPSARSVEFPGSIFSHRIAFAPTGELYVLSSTTLRRFTATGAIDTTFDIGSGPGSGSTLGSVWPQSDGKVLVAGSFNSFAGFPRDSLVRLNADGTVDPAFDAGPALPAPFGSSAIATDTNGQVWRLHGGVIRRLDANGGNPAIVCTLSIADGAPIIASLSALPNGKMLVIGYFDRANGVGRKSLVRLNPDGSVDGSFDAGIAAAFFLIPNLQDSPHVFPDGRLHSGVRLLVDGRLDPSFVAPTPATGLVACATTMSDGRIIVGGRFTHIDGQVRATLAILQPDGTVDLSFDPGVGANATVEVVAVQTDGSILAGGSFSSVQGNLRNGLARFHPDGSLDQSFDAGLNNNAIVRAIAVQDSGVILIGGAFTTAGGQANTNVACLLPSGALNPSFTQTTGATGTNAAVRHIEKLANGQWLVAGSFDAWNNTRRWSVARINANGSLDSSFDPGSNTSGFRADSASVGSDNSVTLGGARLVSTPALAVVQLDDLGNLRFARDIVGYSSSVVVGIYQETPALLVEPGGGALVGLELNDGLLPTSGPSRRVEANGSLDNTFAPEFDLGNAHTFVRESNGSVLMGGSFVGVDGMAYAGLLRLVAATPASRLTNISTRGYVGAGDEVMIAGFYVSGEEPQRVLIRGVARHLEQFGILNHATTPSIHVYRNGETTPFAENYNWYYGMSAGWSNTPAESARIAVHSARLGAFPFEEVHVPIGQTTSYDAALLLDLPAGGYTVQMRADTPGIGLVEVYDDNGVGAVRKLINISTRGRVGTGDQRLITGFVVDRGIKRLLIRAVGPGLASLIGGTLANPTIDLVRQSDQASIATNDNWGDNANAAAIAAASLQVSGLQLAPGSADAALLLDLPAGSYTVVVSGVGATTGIALAEVYEVP